MELEESLYFLYNSNEISYELNGNDVYKFEKISGAATKVGDEYKYMRFPESLTPDENKTYYKKTGSNTVAVATKEEMDQAISENPYNVYNYFELYDDYKIKTFFKSVESEVILNEIAKENNVCYLVAYDEKNDLFYFNFSDNNDNRAIYDSNGNLLSTKYTYHKLFENSLIYAYERSDSPILFLDQQDNVLYEDQTNTLWLLSDYAYDNYVLSFYNVTMQSKVTLYKIYELKLLSDDNRIINEENDFEVKFSGPISKLKAGTIKINGEVLDENNYTLTSGSTIINLKPEYLNSLEDGEYILTLEYDGDIELKTTFKKSSNYSENIPVPKTFDNFGFSIVLLVMSLIGLIFQKKLDLK
jgi:hypothetical protein